MNLNLDRIYNVVLRNKVSERIGHVYPIKKVSLYLMTSCIGVGTVRKYLLRCLELFGALFKSPFFSCINLCILGTYNAGSAILISASADGEIRIFSGRTMIYLRKNEPI
jgi:hypothetical protein